MDSNISLDEWCASYYYNIVDIKKPRSCVRLSKYEISLHAQQERYQEDITLAEIEEAIINGEIIEEYPNDPRGPSCLILGYSHHRPIHIACGMLPTGWMRIITVYIPKMPKWVNPKQRRRSS